MILVKQNLIEGPIFELVDEKKPHLVFKRPALLRKRPAGMNARKYDQLDLLEICAFPGSALSHVWANRGLSAIRIAHRKSFNKRPKLPPIPKKKRARTWYHPF